MTLEVQPGPDGLLTQPPGQPSTGPHFAGQVYGAYSAASSGEQNSHFCITGLLHCLVTIPWLIIQALPPLQVGPQVPGGASQVAMTSQAAEAVGGTINDDETNPIKIKKLITIVLIIRCILVWLLL